MEVYMESLPRGTLVSFWELVFTGRFIFEEMLFLRRRVFFSFLSRVLSLFLRRRLWRWLVWLWRCSCSARGFLPENWG